MPSKKKTRSSHTDTKPTAVYDDPLDLRTGDTTESAGDANEMDAKPAVNRKKQKRREKEAAKRMLSNGHSQTESEPVAYPHALPLPPPNGQLGAVKQGRGPVRGYFTEEPDYVDPDYRTVDEEEEFYSHDDDLEYDQTYAQGPDHSWLNTSKRKKIKKRTRILPIHSPSSSQRPFPTLSNAALRSAHKMSTANDHIWNTSTQAERENIKQFWLELGEDDRRSLVRVEKEAVLRKMKEQQKHSCSCSVCGRKRTAIEEELEVLYDAYYKELEQFANHDEELSGRMMPPPPRTPYRNAHPMAGSYPTQTRIHELDDDDEDLEDEDEYDDEEDDEEEYSDEYEDDLPPGPADFFQFGNSLTVKDGILTVADDLLKNDGKHFIEMMESLAERRLQREEDIIYSSTSLAHQDSRQSHNHQQLDDEDDYDDEEDDEDYDSQDEEDYEGDEMDSMTEEQRMEEGRRMFQIFAARMFEQRVLTAYKEKVAAERQKKLLEELEAEEDKSAQREAKKAKDAAKKKEKKARQKAVKDEEKAKRDAEKAAAEAAIREAEERKAAEKKARQDEQRKKREAERKAAEEDRLKKEAEKTARLAKEKERQQELERKAKEAKEREKKQREEQRKKDREERDAKEAEAKEKRLQEERERKEREAQQRKEKEAALKHARPQPIALPPGLVPPARISNVQSPHVPIATPVVPPTIPVPVRSQQTSQPSQQSHSSSPHSARASTEISQSSTSPANASSSQSQTPAINMPPAHLRQGPPLHHPQPNAPRSPLNNLAHNGRGGQFQHNYGGLYGGLNGIPASAPQHMPINAPNHVYPGPPVGNHHRMPVNGMPFPPGFHGPRQFQPPQHMPFTPPPPMSGPINPQQLSTATNNVSHSRQPSGSETGSQPAPIARPGPIARPSSTTPDKQKYAGPDSDVEKIATQLGSSALLDDSDSPFAGQLDNARPAPLAPPGTGRLPFASFGEKPGFGMGSSHWPSFNAPNHFSHPRPGWPQPSFDPLAQPSLSRPHVPRPIAVRLLLVQAFRQISAQTPKGSGYYPASQLLRQVEQIQPPGEPAVSMDEMLGICDTEGNVQNGGGTFEVMLDASQGQVIKFVEDKMGMRAGPDLGAPAPIAAPSTSFGNIGQGMHSHHQGMGYRHHGLPGRGF